MFSLALFSKLWGLSWVRGSALAIGVVVVVMGWGALRHHDGYSEGYREAKRVTEAAWSADAALARASALKATMRADSATSALRDSLSVATTKVALFKESAALARGQYAEALRQYQLVKANARDTSSTAGTALPAACDALASSCSNALAAAQSETNALVEKLRVAEALSADHERTIASEHARWTPVIQDALAQQRQTFRAPSRLAWSVGGTVVGSLLTLLVHH